MTPDRARAREALTRLAAPEAKQVRLQFGLGVSGARISDREVDQLLSRLNPGLLEQLGAARLRREQKWYERGAAIDSLRRDEQKRRREARRR